MSKEGDLIAKLEEYINFLSKEIGKSAVYLHVHGFGSDDAAVADSKRLRTEIAALKQELGYDQKDND